VKRFNCLTSPGVTLLLFGLFYFHSASAQIDYAWWNAKHNWDGFTHWSAYMKLVPAFMGPNALPVPEFSFPDIPTKPQLVTGVSTYLGKGDFTVDNNLKITIPLKDIVKIDIWGVTAEYFKNDTITRDERIIRHYNSEGLAFGDVYFSTTVILISEQLHRPGLSFRFAFRTASGKDLAYARYTDTPGYFFDITAGKSLTLNSRENALRFYGMAGFYAWQTYDILHPQNDAFLYGIGLRWNPPRSFSIAADWSGYVGYMNSGDRPMVFRSKILFPFTTSELFVGHVMGIHDYPYFGINCGFLFNFGLSN
jgi:hypothetical protein